VQVWGRDEDGGGLTFKQEDISMIVETADHRHPWTAAGFNPMTADYGLPIRCLCISVRCRALSALLLPELTSGACGQDINKQLLLHADGFIPLLIDSLFLDPAHPRRQEPDFERVKGAIQLDFAEALHQVAVFGPGRAALLQEPAVVPTLEEVARSGFTEEAKMSAQRTLATLNPAAVTAAPHATDAPHLMMSCTQSRPLCTARPPLTDACL
jgi:hypothetical protein